MLKLFKKESSDSLNSEIDWSSDRYTTIVAQRNVLLLLILVLLLLVFVCTVTILKISTSSTIKPFVIEIEKKSGVVQLVDPVTVKQYSANKVLNNHFITEYIKAREIFDQHNYKYNYFTKVRLFSSPNVYNEFKNYISSQNMDDLFNLYSDFIRNEFKVRSIQKLYDNTFQVRFTIEFVRKDGSHIKKNKIAIIAYKYVSLEMNDQQRYINPLGFQVTSYRVDEEYV